MSALCFVVACKGRLAFLKQSLPTALALPDTSYVLVDYDCPEKCGDWAERAYPQVRVIRVHDRPKWNPSEGKNLGVAYVEAPWICLTDADIMWDPKTMDILRPLLIPGQFLRPANHQTGVNGTIFCTREDFLKAGGFDEVYQGWGFEDSDFRHMLRNCRIRESTFPNALVRHIDHDNDLRGRFSWSTDVQHSWSANKAYNLMKEDMMAFLKGPVSLEMRKMLYDLAIKAANMVVNENPTASVTLQLDSPDKWKDSKFSVGRSIVYKFERKEG